MIFKNKDGLGIQMTNNHQSLSKKKPQSIYDQCMAPKIQISHYEK